MKKKRGLAGRCELEHVGFLVPNLTEAVDFFENIIGASLVCCRQVLVAGGDPVAVDRAKLCQVAILACENGCHLELMQCLDGDKFNRLVAPSDHHLAFYVDDIVQAVGYLKARGIAVMGEAETTSRGAREGKARVYFRAPWGMQLELVATQEV